MITNYEMSKSPNYVGQIQPMAEKEKRGKRVKIPKSETYVQELTINVSINIPSPD